MTPSPLIVVDADAIVARANLADVNHQKSLEITEKLVALGAEILYPLTAVTEAVTFIQRGLSSNASAYAIAVEFLNPKANLIPLTPEIYAKAVQDFFSPRSSKQNTLFDCLVAATARIYNADAIFSFDKFYKKKGFKLASEL